MNIEMRVMITRDERGVLSGIDWFRINKISAPVSIGELDVITRAMEQDQTVFADGFDFGRASVADITVDHEYDEDEEYAACTSIVKTVEEFHDGYFVYEVGYPILFGPREITGCPF